LNAALEISGKEDHMGTDFLVSRQKTIEEAKASDDRTRLFYFYIHELFVHYHLKIQSSELLAPFYFLSNPSVISVKVQVENLGQRWTLVRLVTATDKFAK
jgi:hypothetical protein